MRPAPRTGTASSISPPMIVGGFPGPGLENGPVAPGPGARWLTQASPRFFTLRLIDLRQRTETPAGIVSGVSRPGIRRRFGQQHRIEPLRLALQPQPTKRSKSRGADVLSSSFQRHQVGSQIMDVIVLEGPKHIQVRLQWIFNDHLRIITLARDNCDNCRRHR